MVYCIMVKYIHCVSLHLILCSVEKCTSLYHGFKLGHMICLGDMICKEKSIGSLLRRRAHGQNVPCSSFLFICHETRNILGRATDSLDPGIKSHLAIIDM